MHFVITLLAVAAVHLALHVEAWTQIGLLADDRHMVGAAVLRHQGAWTFGSMFVPDVAPGATVALYRPFLDLLFWLEYPWFGPSAFGYHVTNSIQHCATAMVWFVLLRRWTGSAAAGLAGALAFVGWPGHNEALHWIAARVDLQSTLLLSLAVLAIDTAACRSPGTRRCAWSLVAGACAVLAVGSKESGVFVVPLAVVVAVARRAPWVSLPLVLGVAAWLAWRAHLLGTWGAGTHYGWQWSRVGADSCRDWLAMLAAPVHRDYAPSVLRPVLGMLHAGLLLVAAFALRIGSVRLPALVGMALAAMGYVAGIGLERLDLATLENARYSYEPALGLCVLFGIAVASLPMRARGPVLAVLVALHAVALDCNRESWLRAGALYRRMESDIVGVARATGQPVRVLQAPGVYEGAFALLNGFTEFQFMQAFAPPGTDLRGKVTSTQEWQADVLELADTVASRRSLQNVFTVHWNDGALAPYSIDAGWPREPWPGTTLGYAWVARTRPFVGSHAPVHVAVRTSQPIELQVRGRTGGSTWTGPVVSREPENALVPVALSLPLDRALVPEAPVDVDLVVRGAAGERVLHLGTTWPSAR